MKKTLRGKVLIALILATILLVYSNISNAYSVNGSLTSSDKLVAGQEVKVTLSLSDIDMADGVRSITIGKINYDTNVFETISSSNFAGSTGWSMTYKESTGAATLVNLTPMTANGAVVTLTLKVKAGVTTSSTTVKFENIVAAEGTATTGDIPVGTKTVTIKSNTAANSGGEGSSGGNGGGTTAGTSEGTSGTTSDSGTNASAKKPTSNKVTTSNSKQISTLPNTGIALGGIAAISLTLAVSIIGLIFYARYRAIQKYGK